MMPYLSAIKIECMNIFSRWRDVWLSDTHTQAVAKNLKFYGLKSKIIWILRNIFLVDIEKRVIGFMDISTEISATEHVWVLHLVAKKWLTDCWFHFNYMHNLIVDIQNEKLSEALSQNYQAEFVFISNDSWFNPKTFGAAATPLNLMTVDDCSNSEMSGCRN